MDNKITSSRNFTIKNGNTLPNTLKQTCHSNNRQTNNMSNTEIKRVPPECTIQFGMQPLQKQAEIIEIIEIDEIGKKSVYAVQKLLKNENYKKIPFIKSILKNNKTQLEKTFSNGKQTADGDFLLFATGHKPGFLVCSFFQPDITIYKFLKRLFTMVKKDNTISADRVTKHLIQLCGQRTIAAKHLCLR